MHHSRGGRINIERQDRMIGDLMNRLRMLLRPRARFDGRAATADASTTRPKLLLLIREVTKSADLRHELALADALATHADVVIVAPCYLRSAKTLKKSGHVFETYGFGPAHFDTDVVRFSATLIERHAPQWGLVVGGCNAGLVAALDRRCVGLLAFLDGAPRSPSEDDALYLIFRHAAHIVLADASLAKDLKNAAFSLAARREDAVEIAPTLDATEMAGFLLKRGAVIAATETEWQRRTVADVAAIEASGTFVPDLAVPRHIDATGRAAIMFYLRASWHARPWTNLHAGRLLRRPAPGFHPLIYATEAPGFVTGASTDPYAHFLAAGSPAGRWTHPVLTLRAPSASVDALPKCVLHLHLHYPDLLPEILNRLVRCQIECLDLVVTTTSEERAKIIEATLATYDRRANIVVYGNRGRDVWPFIDLLQNGVFDAYDVVGHFHSKKSVHYSGGDVWRDFLGEHLLGGRMPLANIVCQAFKADQRLGLVFAEEPHLDGWDANKGCASLLAGRMGLDLPLPDHLEYPVGTMFWARPAAMAPLRRLNWTEADIPEEPLPVDGTNLHAVECLLVLVAEAAGFTYATTHIPGVTR